MNKFKRLQKVFSMAWEISHIYIFLLIIEAVIPAVQLILNAVLPKFLIDALMAGGNIKNIIFWAAAIVLNNLVFGFLKNVMERYGDTEKRFMASKITQKLSEKILKVEFFYLEDPYYLDLKERAIFANQNRNAIGSTINAISGVLTGIFSLTGLFAIMISLGPVLIIFAAIAIVLTALVYKASAKYQTTFFQNLVPTNRKIGYYWGLCFNDTMQKDIRLYDMKDMLSNKITDINREIADEFITFSDKQKLFGISLTAISNLYTAITYIYIGMRVITDKFGRQIGLGSFTMYVSSAISFSQNFFKMTQSITELFMNLEYLEPFIEFLSLPDEAKDVGHIPFEGEVKSIKFKNVSFCYPKSDKKVLDNISFEIKEKDKISIVGLNGAGKTTLIKLICRLYHPTEGKIYINGRDIFEYEHSSYMKQVATVFQDYKLFNFTIEENITAMDKTADQGRVNKLIEDVGLTEKIKELPKGLQTRFGKAYDEEGIEMSGGQSQKIAIARALYKDASLIILDEPTSALDPLAEAEIYQNFNSLVGDKTAIYISHRMSSSVFCDKVLIINEGKVADFDSHQNLMDKKDSLYYELFNLQAVNYTD